MYENILSFIKKPLGLDESYTVFDMDILMHINSIFYELKQMGVEFPYGVESIALDDTDITWDEMFDSTRIDIEGIKEYVYLKTRLLFDPPSSAVVVEAINKQLRTLEWRINSSYDIGD